MIPFLIYLVTALATGYQVYSRLMWAIWGAPSHTLHYVSLGGSVGLLLSGYASLFKARKAAWLALGALSAIWPLYAAAFFVTFRELLTGDGTRVLRLVHLLPTVLLLLTTGYVGLTLSRAHGRFTGWLFPEGASRLGKVSAGICTAAAAVGIFVAFSF